MTVLNLAKSVLVLHLAASALASPTSLQTPVLNISESGIVPQNPLEPSLSHHVEKRHAVTVQKEINVNASMLSPIGDILRLSLLLPAKKLQMLQMLTTKLVDKSIGVPANLLEGAANLKLEDVKKSLMLKKIAKAGSFEKIKKFVLGQKSITKTISQGPDGIKKTVEIVTPGKTVAVSISKGFEIKTPPPIDAPEITTPATVPEITTPLPVIPVVPVQPVVVLPAPPVVSEITTPAPEVLETTPPTIVVKKDVEIDLPLKKPL